MGQLMFEPRDIDMAGTYTYELSIFYFGLTNEYTSQLINKLVFKVEEAEEHNVMIYVSSDQWD